MSLLIRLANDLLVSFQRYYGAMIVVGTIAALLAASPTSIAAKPATPSFASDVRPVLAAHCVKCHGPAKQKAGLDFSVFSDDKSVFRHHKLWLRVVAQIEARDMPPDREEPLTPPERQLVVGWLPRAIDAVGRLEPADRNPGPARLRRLNRAEYNLTIRDLLGLDFDAAEAVGMTGDAGGDSFDNLADGLSLSQAQLEKYLAAADKILERLLGTADGSPSKQNFNRQQADKARKAILFVQPGDSVSERDAARKIIAAFAGRAYRRPVRETEVDRLLTLYDLAEQRGERYENRARLMLKAVLVSPHFLLRIEENRVPAGSAKAYLVGDHELATRLSYFLWSTMPDEELFALAQQKKLSEPAVVEQQVKRMLADRRARALTDRFAVQWLQLGKLKEARPSQEFFPTFTHGLRQAMYEETVTFFDKLREEDRSVLDLLDADYTYVNQELAKHYNITGIEGAKLVRVALKPEDNRGGLLGMGSILTMTSHTSRTSPTLRGKWLLDVIFGAPPPPPPPDAGALKEEKSKGVPKSFRELMALHSTKPTCAACHRRMDPLGYALDTFDAVGRRRDSNGQAPLDISGELPTGEKFNGPQELKRIILNRKDEFVRNLSQQMLVYALGRELQYYDEYTVRETAKALAKSDYRFSTLIMEIANSHPFRYRRNAGAAGDDD